MLSSVSYNPSILQAILDMDLQPGTPHINLQSVARCLMEEQPADQIRPLVLIARKQASASRIRLLDLDSARLLWGMIRFLEFNDAFQGLGFRNVLRRPSHHCLVQYVFDNDGDAWTSMAEFTRCCVLEMDVRDFIQQHVEEHACEPRICALFCTDEPCGCREIKLQCDGLVPHAARSLVCSSEVPR